MKFDTNNLKTIIENRRTIYPEQFTDKKISREDISKILDSARWAPNHKSTQPWLFKVFMGDSLKKLADFQSNQYKNSTPSDEFLQGKFDKLISRPISSQAIIATCVNRDEKESVPEIEEIVAVGAAMENMFLTGTALGIGMSFLTGGLTNTDVMKNFLGLKQKDIHLGSFYLGYIASDWPKIKSRKNLDEYTEWQ